jgi:polysaccharide chain length determinant protein (PEP-CTERM system associated)
MTVQRQRHMEDWLLILRRRLWLLLIPVLLFTVAGCVLSFVLPKQYTSETRVLVQAPIVPDSYVKPVVSDDLNRRLAAMQGEILSRSRLQHLVEQLNLFPNDLGHVPMEVLVERLRKSIKVTPLNPTPGTLPSILVGFNIEVTFENPGLAQQVCQQITSMFTDENVRLREKQSEDTTQFLAKQLDEAKTKLDEQDSKLADFQTHYMGAQPQDEQTNLTLLSGMTPRLDAVTQDLNQAQQNKAFADSMLSQQLAGLKTTDDGHNPQTLQQQLTDLQSQLLSLEARYTDKHPAVLKLKDEIAGLQERIRNAPSQDQSHSSTQADNAPVIEPIQIQQLRAQVRQADVMIAQKKKEQVDLEQQIKVLQDRIHLTPVVQEEFKSLTRDYQTALNFYNDLLKKREEAQMATELEHRQQGENFSVLDPPSLPEKPSFPDGRLFTLGGFLCGLVLGGGLVQLAETLDKSMSNERDVEAFLGLSALAVIPSMEPPRRSSFMAWMNRPVDIRTVRGRRASAR